MQELWYSGFFVTCLRAGDLVRLHLAAALPPQPNCRASLALGDLYSGMSGRFDSALSGVPELVSAAGIFSRLSGGGVFSCSFRPAQVGSLTLSSPPSPFGGDGAPAVRKAPVVLLWPLFDGARPAGGDPRRVDAGALFERRRPDLACLTHRPASPRAAPTPSSGRWGGGT